MKTKIAKCVNPVLVLVLFMVLCPGKNEANAQLLSTDDQAKSQLHIPWKMLSERLSAIANSGAADGSASATPIENRLIPVPYEGETINWNLAAGRAQADIEVGHVSIDASSAQIEIPNSKIQIAIDRLDVDQVIEREIGGVRVRVRLQASCGPILVEQASAQAAAAFALAWSNGSPSASLSNLTLTWPANSWTFNNFTCAGPSGLDQLIRDGVSDFLKDPASLKPYVETYISSNLKTQLDLVLAKLRSPLAVGSAKEPISVTVGAIAPVSTGVIVDLTLKTDDKSVSVPAAPLPASSVLASLAKNEPTLIGDLGVLQFIVDTKLRSQKSYYRFDLQTVPSFNKLMHSRTAQLFAWRDLWHYPENNPFPLTIYKPSSLKLERGSGSSLASTIPLRTIIQSYRKKAWWVYVETSGTARMAVDVTVSSGRLSYSTKIDSLKIKSKYSKAYSQAFDKDDDDTLPDDVVAKALVGPRPELSGTMVWPLIDLETAGKFRASSLTWLDKKTFSLRFRAVD